MVIFPKSPPLFGKEPKGEEQMFSHEGVLLLKGATSPEGTQGLNMINLI